MELVGLLMKLQVLYSQVFFRNVVKESMNSPKRIRKILVITFTFIGLLFLAISTTFYYVA